MPSISAIILTLNEEINIQRCLNSLQQIADEVIIVDSFSTDNTRKIAEAAGARFVTEPWKGYAAAKNQAMDLAFHPFILFMDADEELSDELRKSILKKKDKLKGAYSFNRLNNYCGKWIRHGGFYPDKKIRLIEKGCADWEGDFVHEKIVCKPDTIITQLTGDLFHYSYYAIEEHKMRLEKYARLGAESLIHRKATFIGIKKIINPVAKFLRHYVLNAGFLDGMQGFQLAFYSAREVYLKYKYAARKTHPGR